MIMNLALAAFLGICLVPVALLASWILYPVNDARMRLKAPTQFVLTDFFWLMTLFQAALAFTTQFVPQREPEAMWLILLFLFPALTLLWAAGVNFLSQAGVRGMFRRGLFQLLLLPGTMLVMIGLPFLFLLTLASARNDIDWKNPLNIFFFGLGRHRRRFDPAASFEPMAGGVDAAREAERFAVEGDVNHGGGFSRCLTLFAGLE